MNSLFKILASTTSALFILTSAAVAFAAEKTVVFSVNGIECARDEVAVSSGLRKVAGVLDAEADMTDHTATVKYDDAVTGSDFLKKAIEAAGSYKVEKTEDLKK